MRLWLGKVRRGDKLGLVPTDDASRAALARMEDGEVCEFQFSRVRSVQWNKKYWAMCREIGENQDPARDEDSIDAELRILAGHFEVYYFDCGQVRVPKRLAFDKLDGDGWAEYYKKVEVAIAERFGPEYIQEMHSW